MEVGDLVMPRNDFYQDTSQLVLSLYLKGYGAAEVKSQVQVTFHDRSVNIVIPDLQVDDPSKRLLKLTISPLYGSINTESSSHRVVSSKIELKLVKASPQNWPSLLASPATSTTSQILSDPSSVTQVPHTSTAHPEPAASPRKERKNWDKMVQEDDEEPDSKDPNAGGDAALQKFFSTLYAGADEDTKKAMVKSFTESGGTSLSTNWDTIGKETTQIHPPEGMEARKYN